MWVTYEYNYNLGNLNLATIKWIEGWLDSMVLLLIVIWLILAIIYYIMLPYINAYLIIRKEDMKKIENKNKIKELILMKEVQNELEKEMEETLLNAWLKRTEGLS